MDGGTHLSRFPHGLDAHAEQLRQERESFKGHIVPREMTSAKGLTAIISVRVPEPQFEARRKRSSAIREVEGIVSSAVGEFLTKYWRRIPGSPSKIVRKGILAAEAREAARKAKDMTA